MQNTDVIFQNNGVLDAVSIATFGVNAKQTDNPIGYFGTGLKYAIAVLLRENHRIVIQAGDEVFEFTREQQDIRGKAFELIKMNDTLLGFTTDLGKNWEMWQAFRELYCNAMDEHDGLVTTDPTRAAHDSEKTTITVTGSAFHECYLSRSAIVLESKPKEVTEWADIHAGRSEFVYYKGIRIYDGFPISVYTYNIHTGLDISEDRSAIYGFQMARRIATAIVLSEDEDFIEEVLLSPRGTLEADVLDYMDVYDEPTDAFLAVAERLRLNPAVNSSVFKVLAKHRRLPPPPATELTDIQRQMLKRAIVFCNRIGYPVDTYPITTTSELRGGMLGLAKDKEIYLSPDTYGFGTKYVAATLIEEYLHLHTGHGDMTRELQNHLFNDIVSLGERLIGEPV